MIRHHPYLDTEKVCRFYSEKDGEAIRYVCTSAADSSAVASDIFYRETPHPEFGNRYFGLRRIEGTLYIHNADNIEHLDFGMLYGSMGWEYSQHRWDCRYVGDAFIDGGRAYIRAGGEELPAVKVFRVKDGEFIEHESRL